MQTGAFLIALRAKGETVSELVGLARTMRSLAAHVEIEQGRPARHRRHRRRPDHLQHLDHRRADRGGRRLRGRQARQPLGDQPVRVGGPARGARRRHRADARAEVATCIDEIGFGFMFAPKHHKAMAARGPGAQGARGAHDLQLPRPAHQPGRGRRQLLGVSDRGYQEIDRRGPAPARLLTRAGGLRRRRHRRAQHRVADPGDRGGRGRTEEWFVEADELGLEPAPLDAIPGGEPAENAAVVRRRPRGRGRAAARGLDAQRRRGDLRRRRGGRTWPRGSSKARRAVDDGRGLRRARPPGRPLPRALRRS